MIEWIVPIVVAFITGGLSLIGVILTNNSSNRKIEHRLEIGQAVTDNKIDNLTLEVRGLKDFAVEVPVIKQRLSVCEEDIKELKSK